MRTITNFPEVIDFSTVPVDLIVNTQNSSVICEPGSLKLFPANGGGYVGLRDIWFSGQQKVISVGEEILFTPTILDNIDRSLKHIIINRGTELVRDGSDDRGIAYLWRDVAQNFSVGACHVTECLYEGGGLRPGSVIVDGYPTQPITPEMFSLRRFVGQKIYLVIEFNLNDHMVRVYVSTKDGAYRNQLLAEHTLNVVEPEHEFWTRIDILGAYVDRGVVSGSQSYMDLSKVTVHNQTQVAPDSWFNDYVEPTPIPPPPVITQHRELDNALQKALSNVGVDAVLSGGQFEVEGGEIRMTPICVSRGN